MDDATHWGTFQEQLRETLAHLYDPTFVPPDMVAASLGIAPGERDGSARAAIAQGIHDLRPAPETPSHARANRLYQVLVLRYLQQLTQEEAALRLGITVRHLAREQAQAIDLLARHIWEREGKSTPLSPAFAGERGVAAEPPSSHVEDELTSLHECSPHAVTDIGPVLHDVIGVTSVLAERYGVSVQSNPVESGTVVAIHPSILSQALIAAIAHLVRAVPASRVTVSVERVGAAVRIAIEGGSGDSVPPPANWYGRELVVSQGGTFDVQAHGEGLSLYITLPATRRIRVLIVDDNQDLAHYYGLCMIGTPYEMVHVSEGRRVFEEIDEINPDLLVLDLMLPDMDGWELLVHLHGHPRSSSLPIIVCSVVQDEELAFALGATECLAKPVRRDAFLQTLDRALSRGSTAKTIGSGNSAAPC